MNSSILVGKNAPLSKLPRTFPKAIDESLSLGLDLGVGSCGQALVYDQEKDKENCQISGLSSFPHRIAFLGVRAFDIPETREKSGVKLKNPDRRSKRLMRRTIRRRAQRMWAIRRLFKQQGLLPNDYPTDPDLWKNKLGQAVEPSVRKWSVWHAQMTDGEKGRPGPLELRVKGLTEKLEPLEWAAALFHLAKHRGFRSNRKAASSEDDDGKVLAAIGQNRKRMADNGYETIAEMMLKDEAFAERKRNREGIYTSVVQREDHEAEIKLLFEKQRKFGSTHASSDFETLFLKLFNKQLPLKNSLNLLGDCPFEIGEKRGPRAAYSFELCRALQRLNNLNLALPDGSEEAFTEWALKGDGYQTFCQQFGDQKKISYQDLRSIFAIPLEIGFCDLPVEPSKSLPKDATSEDFKKAAARQLKSAENKDFVSRTSNAAEESYRLRNALGESLWQIYKEKAPHHLDNIAFALSFFEEIDNEETEPEFWGIIDQMRSDEVPKELIKAVEDDLRSEKPTLHKFNGTTSMSTLASRKLIPLLTHGQRYSEACSQLYGDHRKALFSFDSITNPVVKSVVREVLKQVVHLIDEAGALPDRICVEIGRDLGKSVKDRNEIDREIKKRTSRKKANAKKFEDLLKRPPNPDELLAYELYLEQATRCPYCGDCLPNPFTWQTDPQDIDHILPRSRSHDNSYDNKVLVHKRCNQNKGSQTPSEWLGQESENWRILQASIAQMPGLRPRKRRNLLNTTFANDEAKFAARHLNDTRYISKLVTQYLQALYEIAGEKPVTEKGGIKRVFVQPGALTSLVRKTWGLENLKKDRNDRRLGDKHHAIDALICALLSEGQRQFVTRSEQQKRAAREVAIFKDFADSYQEMEKKNDHCRTPRHISPPWKDFREDIIAALDNFTVSRRENRSGRGALHNDTIYRVEAHGDENKFYSRKALVDSSSGTRKAILTKIDDLEKVKDIDLDRNRWLKDCLTSWIENGSPVTEEDLPRDTQGALIRKLTIGQKKKTGRHYPQGFVAGGKMIRTDIFSKPNKKGKKNYFAVPVYAHQLVDELPPMRAATKKKPEFEWDQIDENFSFEFSLWSNSRFEIVKKTASGQPNKVLVALYVGLDRDDNCRIEYRSADDSEIKGRVSGKTGTILFRKIETDRLGREFLIKKKKRIWRGKIID